MTDAQAAARGARKARELNPYEFDCLEADDFDDYTRRVHVNKARREADAEWSETYVEAHKNDGSVCEKCGGDLWPSGICKIGCNLFPKPHPEYNPRA